MLRRTTSCLIQKTGPLYSLRSLFQGKIEPEKQPEKAAPTPTSVEDPMLNYNAECGAEQVVPKGRRGRPSIKLSAKGRPVSTHTSALIPVERFRGLKGDVMRLGKKIASLNIPDEHEERVLRPLVELMAKLLEETQHNIEGEVLERQRLVLEAQRKLLEEKERAYQSALTRRQVEEKRKVIAHFIEQKHAEEEAAKRISS